MNQSIRIALIDWNSSVRSARQAILDATGDIEVVFESDGNNDDLSQLPDLLVDVIVIDQQLDSKTGVEAFLELRGKYSELTDIPKAILTTVFDAPSLRVQALGAGMYDVVSIDSGPHGLINAIKASTASEPVLDLAGLAELLTSNPPPTRHSFELSQAVIGLPVRKKGSIDKLALEWPKIKSGSVAKLSLEQFQPLATTLGFLTACELVIKLLQNGELDAK
jgi:DNA-binding NarL/FixJ family response regulator